MHRRVISTKFGLLGTLWIAFANPGWAVDIESLIMPGPLSAAHADQEGDCSSCHQPFRGEAERQLCLVCHVEVGEDLEHDAGFHGHNPGVANSRCRSCHPEHKGRDADIAGLDRDTFDHDFTDYPLRGAHRRLGCGTCHESGVKRREAPSDCSSCHRNDDVHDGEMKGECGECHGEDNWKQARFDHDSTGFALVGQHREVDCGLCHPSQRYEETPSDCYSCHRLDDSHSGRFGSRCGDCHRPADWKLTSFDHDRATDFPLTGKHRKASCEACHTGPLEEQKLSTDCVSCHRLDDRHRGANGQRCEDCHGTEDWTHSSFDHAQTSFPLDGRHAEAPCRSCHPGNVYEEEIDPRCASCHVREDAHRGQLGKRCGDCHDERSWTGHVFFDHEITRFPLLGLHASVSCEECHRSGAFKDAESECAACHVKEDSHEERLGSQCASCHNPNGWKRWRFDHDTRTAFALHGAHEGLDCRSCHTRPMKDDVEIAMGCLACHALDDAHGGAFGRDCERCHSSKSWTDVQLGR